MVRKEHTADKLLHDKARRLALHRKEYNSESVKADQTCQPQRSLKPLKLLQLQGRTKQFDISLNYSPIFVEWLKFLREDTNLAQVLDTRTSTL
jgi:hypothetical protein